MTISGKSLFEAVQADIESFFEQSSGFKITAKLDSNSICCKGSGEECIIHLSRDFCHNIITTLDDLHLSLFVICHEIAHYLHKHNNNNDKDHIETKSIEDWADFYGTKLMMTTITFGNRTQEIYRSFDGASHSGERIDSMGRALERLAETFYKVDSNLYSNRLSRVGFSVAGINSFFDKYYGSMVLSRSFSIMKRIYLKSGISNIIDIESDSFMKNTGSLEKVDEIHKRIQESNPSISNGLRPEFEIFIGTNYDTTPEQRANYIQAMRNEAKRQGLDVEACLKNDEHIE